MENKTGYVIEMNAEFFENMGEYENLLLNLVSGLSVDDLSEDEIQLMVNKHGEEWRKELGYE